MGDQNLENFTLSSGKISIIQIQGNLPSCILHFPLPNSLLRMLFSCNKVLLFRNILRKTKFPRFNITNQRYLSFRDQVEQYKEDGVICLRGCFSKHWVDTVKRGIQKVYDNPSKYSEKIISNNGKGVYFNDYLQWRNIEEFQEYIKDSPAPEIAATLLQEEVNFGVIKILIKIEQSVIVYHCYMIFHCERCCGLAPCKSKWWGRGGGR